MVRKQRYPLALTLTSIALAFAAILTSVALVVAILTGTLTIGQKVLPTSSAPKVNVVVLGCNTGFDISHGMGEVTNAYVTVSNVGDIEVSDVLVTLKADDEGRRHPDKTRRVQHLPPRHEVTLKLTVDTEFGEEGAVEVVVTTKEGVRERTTRSDCREIDPELLEKIGTVLGIVRPIVGGF